MTMICGYGDTDFPIASHEVIVCPECIVPHHTDCWNNYNGCSTLGCRYRDSGAIFSRQTRQYQAPTVSANLDVDWDDDIDLVLNDDLFSRPTEEVRPLERSTSSTDWDEEWDEEWDEDSFSLPTERTPRPVEIPASSIVWSDRSPSRSTEIPSGIIIGCLAVIVAVIVGFCVYIWGPMNRTTRLPEPPEVVQPTPPPYQSPYDDIFKAAEHGTVQDIDFFYKKGVNVNDKDVNGITPLHYAAGFNINTEPIME